METAILHGSFKDNTYESILHDFHKVDEVLDRALGNYLNDNNIEIFKRDNNCAATEKGYIMAYYTKNLVKA